MDKGIDATRHFIVGLPETGLDEGFEKVVRETPLAGFILFRKNFSNLDRLEKLIERLRELSSPHDILIAVDEEGGFVSQLRPDATVAPSARVLGRAASMEEVERIAEETGRQLRERGVDIDFAPVYDVDVEPTNPVIGPRAFDNDPGRVSELANAFARGLTRGGVMPCAKHFPGHGDTRLDSHLTLPVCTTSMEDLESIHLPPFRGAIATGVPLIMVSHVSYSSIDESPTPATLSSRIVQDLLRSTMGFKGVIVTDALEMQAVADPFPPEEAGTRALLAGCDLLLYGTYNPIVEAALRGTREAITEGRITEENLAASQQRIIELQERARRARATVRSKPDAGVPDNLTIARRALRWIGETRKPADAELRKKKWLVVEPDWPGGASVEELLLARGLETTGTLWEDLEGLNPEPDQVILAVSPYRTPPPVEALRWLQRTAQKHQLWVAALGQDAFLQALPGVSGRLSGCDPGPEMRLALVEELLGELVPGEQ